MLAAFKESFLPLLVYLLVIGSCIASLSHRPQLGLWLYCVLVMFPQFWHPIHDFPLGSMALSLLFASVLAGSYVKPQVHVQFIANQKLILILIGYSFLALWNVLLRYNIPLSFDLQNPLLKLWLNFATMTMLYLAAYRAIRNEEDIRFLIVLLTSILILISWREYRNFYSSSSFSYSRRAEGTFGMMGMGANHFGAFISNMSALAIGLFTVDRHRGRRAVYFAAFLSALYPLFYSYSRGAYIALLVALAVIGLLRHRAILILLSIFVIFWQSVLPDSVVERLTMTENSEGVMEESAGMRLVVWNLALDLFADHPLFGIGLYGFYFATDGLPLRNAHNYYLTVAAEQGLIGLVLLTVILLRALASGWKLYKNGSCDLIRGTGLGFISFTISMIVTNMFGDRFSQLAMGSYFWILFGVVERALIIQISKAPKDTAK